MFKLIKLSILLQITFVVLILLYRLIGIAQYPAIPLASLFTETNGNTCENQCIVGIYPSITRMEAASDVFAQHPISQHLATRPGGGTLAAWDRNGDEFMATCCDGFSTINQVSWSKTLSTPHYEAGDAIKLLGTPDCVQVSAGNYSFYYPSTKLLVFGNPINFKSLSLNDPIRLIIIYGKLAVMDCDKQTANRWHGFATDRRYALPERFR